MAPAQEVVITDQLDIGTMDLDTFSLGPLSLGDITVTPAPGVSQYTGSVDLRPNQNLIVLINAGLDKNTGIVTWRFASVDPTTLQLTDDPLAGFLPPNVNPPGGEGSVLFTVMPRQGLATGTAICNQARIVFDVNAPLDTPQWCNTLDDTKPQSQVLPLAATQSSPTFPVQWAGTDTGSGISNYTIFVSENGGPFTSFLTNTTDTAAMFTGQVGNTYAFYSVARDRSGNEEDPPTTADTTTQVAGADQCPDDPHKTEPGVCGCGVPDTDSDGDGTLDCNDQCPADAAKVAPGACGCGVPDSTAGQPCTTGLPGVCSVGTIVCTGGSARCVQNQQPSAEVCDGLDNNCDGQTDEGLGTLSCGVGACARTVNACVNGVPQTCTPGSPSAEICGDGLDNDCDGVVDNGCSPPPGFQFSGFFPPVDNPPTLNVVKAGSAVPVKFSLNGNQGLNIFAVGYPKSQAIVCDATNLLDSIEETVTAGSSSLSYDASTDQYIYVWKTTTSWAQSCRQLVVMLNDGSPPHVANFQFTK